MAPVILTFLIMFGGTYSISSMYLKKDEKIHRKTTVSRIID